MNLDLSLSYRRLLVIIRTGHDDCAALALGEAIAARCGALLLLRAFDDPSDPMPPDAALSWLSTTVARLSGQVREVSGELIARQPLHEAMRADIEALQPDLAIKELRRESALRRWLFTAEDTFLTRHATRPLLVVGENQSPLPKRVVAAVDPGPADQEEALNGRIVDEARRFADAVGAELHLAHAVDPIIDLPADPTMQLVGTTPLMAEELQALQRGRFERLAETMGFDRSQCHLLIGRADVALEGLCERIGADLLVTGHHRRQPLERLLGGSVSEGLIGTARRAVMVIPDCIAPHAD